MDAKAEAPTPIRVAILGGGAAALAAAYALSERGGYEITVYQMGWRLGGKCASGRRLDDGRVQEHGLHVLGGFYHNALGLLRRAYEAWPQCSAHALTFDEAFTPQSKVHVVETDADGSYPVRFPFPENGRRLGRDPQELNLLTVARQLLDYVWGLSEPGRPKPRGAGYAHDHGFREPLQQAREAASPDKLRAGHAIREIDVVNAVRAINQTLSVVQRPEMFPTPPPIEQEPDYGILFEIALVVAKGVLAEGLWWKGFDAANDDEFATWMRRHGLSQRAEDSAYFRCGYDYAFAYEDGDSRRPMMAAGAGLRGFLRMVFTYNRSVFVHMDGSMGEIIFTPLYEVLRSRKVEFKFFHRIDKLELDDDGTRLRRIRGVLQNEPLDDAYDPLCPYEPPGKAERAVWPDRPIASRLRHAIDPAERPEFLYESPWHEPKTAEPFELHADDDFDICILGIPVGALHDVAADLADKIPEWRRMLDGSRTAPTLCAQLWQPKTTAELGWPNGPTVLTANAPPHSTWADMSYLLRLEKNPAKSGHLSYFCGPVGRAHYTVSPYDSDYGPPELQRGRDATRQWSVDYLADLLPHAHLPAASAPGHADELYDRMNSFPSELYVLTTPGAVKDRLTPGGSFLPNLFLAGDWTKNGYDIGSFETAILSGLMCAREISGTNEQFPGERDRGW